MEGFGWYTFENLKRIVTQHPEHEFFFFFDRQYDPKFVFADNVTPVVVHPQARHPELYKIWFNYSVTRAIKKYKCDAFISPDGYLSLRTKVPQLIVMHDLNFEHNPQDLPKSALNYYKKYFPIFAQRAKRIVTVSEFSKQDIIQQYHIAPHKIDVGHNGASPVFKPISEEDKEIVKQKFSKGKNYILFVGALSPRKNLGRLIAAFDALHQEGHNDLELVIVGEDLFKSMETKIEASTKVHIHFTGHLSQTDLAQVVAGAHIFAFVPYFEGFGIPLLEAMQSGVPCLAANATSLPEVGGDAVLYCDPYDVISIKEGLIRLKEDKTLRSTLKEKGPQRALNFSWDKSAEVLWSAFLKMMD
ncbi:Glycosyltransferase involved in cell wall bisynthesis [Lishizhenia tianjinensis]|uniref:Glycosyltransferase involved in cell wall bisynthesis n=2 Tax=Lishizhenia tianjinensis TaxID=477690 RepID=A0A1I7BQF2_9FLAO|nr:Glycosyltransferase involved in cell wall bisynthesis [Lishizhenia tianjinensis]